MSWLSKIFGKSDPAPAKPTPQAATPAAAPAPKAASQPAATKAAAPVAPGSAPRTFTGEMISISLAGIVKSLANDLKPLIATVPDGKAQFQVPLQLVLEGLPKGAVKVSFAELKRGAPAGTFTGATEHDAQMVSLPLNELVPKLKPEHLKPKTPQKTVSVPDDIKPVFGQAQTAAPTPPAPKPAAPAPAAAAPVPAQAPNPAATAPPPAAPVASTDPQSFVKTASGLPGVSGALLSMQDGLSVAKQLPAEINADTLAAFVPDVFTRLGNCAKDLKLGPVTAVTVQAGSQTIHILKGGKLYLSLLGKAGEQPDAAKVEGLAKQLAELNK